MAGDLGSGDPGRWRYRAAMSDLSLQVPARFHDPTYERPVRSRYVDPVEVIWLAAARRLGITLRRDATVFSMTDGSGTLWLSTREHLDADDCLAQMMFHELCHWVTNGREVVTERDWGFPLYDLEDVREHGCLRLPGLVGGPARTARHDGADGTVPPILRPATRRCPRSA